MTSPPHREPGHRPARTLHRRTHGPLRAHHNWHRAAANRGLRPATVWPFADAEPLPGTARLAGWLGRTIITLVTTYTRPGDRILLLTPPTLVCGRSEQSYAGLAEAVWTVTRLGRSADTATAAPPPDHPQGPTDSFRIPGGESASRLRLSRPRRRTVTDPVAESATCHQRAERRTGAAFDLIITAVEPHATDWLAHADWDALPTQRGLAAVLTHSDSRGPRMLDPQPAIMNTLGEHGLRLVDHIAVLDAPLPSPARDLMAREAAPTGRAHHDLLLLARPSSSGHENAATARMVGSDA